MSFVASAPVVCELDNHLPLAPGISGYICWVGSQGYKCGQTRTEHVYMVSHTEASSCLYLYRITANPSLEGLLNFQGERHVVEHCIYVPVRISEGEEGKLKEASLKTLISDDISNSGRTTVPFFRTPWVNPGQLSKPSFHACAIIASMRGARLLLRVY